MSTETTTPTIYHPPTPTWDHPPTPILYHPPTPTLYVMESVQTCEWAQGNFKNFGTWFSNTHLEISYLVSKTVSRCVTRFILVCHQWCTTSLWTFEWCKPWVWHHLHNPIKQCTCLGSGSVSWRIQSWTHVRTLQMFYSTKQHLTALITE